MDKGIRDFLESDQNAKQMYTTGLPLKTTKKKPKKPRHNFRPKRTGHLNRSLGPLSSTRTVSQRNINREFTDLLIDRDRHKYKNLKKKKFCGSKFDDWRSQNESKLAESKMNLTKKKLQLER